MRLRPSRNRGSRTHDNLTIPHHLHGKDTLPMQPKPTQKPTPAREIEYLTQKTACTNRYSISHFRMIFLRFA